MKNKTAIIIYRENKPLNDTQKIIKNHLENLGYEPTIKVFAKRTPEGDIKDWTLKQNFDKYDLIFSDSTYRRANKDHFENDVFPDWRAGYLLDELSNLKSKKYMELIYPQGIQERINTDNMDFSKRIEVINFFKNKPKKIYVGIPRLADHQGKFDLNRLEKYELDENLTLRGDFKGFKTSMVKTKEAKEFLDKELYLTSPGEAAIVAEEIKEKLERDNYIVELTNQFKYLDEIEDESLFLLDRHFAVDYRKDYETQNFSEIDGTKVRLMFDNILPDAVNLGLIKFPINKETANNNFKKTLEERINQIALP